MKLLTAVGSICTQNLLLPIALVITVVGAVVTALVPPLILEKIRGRADCGKLDAELYRRFPISAW